MAQGTSKQLLSTESGDPIQDEMKSAINRFAVFAPELLEQVKIQNKLLIQIVTLLEEMV
jgi:hypothetical protein